MDADVRLVSGLCMWSHTASLEYSEYIYILKADKRPHRQLHVLISQVVYQRKSMYVFLLPSSYLLVPVLAWQTSAGWFIGALHNVSDPHIDLDSLALETFEVRACMNLGAAGKLEPTMSRRYIAYLSIVHGALKAVAIYQCEVWGV